MEKATAINKLEDMCNVKDAAGKIAFDMAAAGQHKVRCTMPYWACYQMLRLKFVLTLSSCHFRCFVLACAGEGKPRLP